MTRHEFIQRCVIACLPQVSPARLIDDLPSFVKLADAVDAVAPFESNTVFKYGKEEEAGSVAAEIVGLRQTIGEIAWPERD